jgi:hypothetical protein
VQEHLVICHTCNALPITIQLRLVEQSLNVKNLLFLGSQFSGQYSNVLFLLIYLRCLSIVLSFKGFLCLADNLMLLKSPFLLVIEHPPEFDDLLLFDTCLVLKNFPQLFFVHFKTFGILLHF